jgi:hypothetical protein
MLDNELLLSVCTFLAGRAGDDVRHPSGCPPDGPGGKSGAVGPGAGAGVLTAGDEHTESKPSSRVVMAGLLTAMVTVNSTDCTREVAVAYYAEHPRQEERLTCVTVCSANATVRADYRNGDTETFRCVVDPDSDSRAVKIAATTLLPSCGGVVDPPKSNRTITIPTTTIPIPTATPTTLTADNPPLVPVVDQATTHTTTSPCQVLFWAARFLDADLSRNYALQRQLLAVDACAFGTVGPDAIVVVWCSSPPDTKVQHCFRKVCTLWHTPARADTRCITTILLPVTNAGQR